MYLDRGLYFRDWQVSCMSRVNKGNGCVKFKLFDMEIEYRKNKQPCCNGNYLNPALVYPVKSGGKEVKKCKGISSQKLRLGIWNWISKRR